MDDIPLVLSVSELTGAIKAQLEPAFRHVWVRGEITNYRLQSSGHHYFSLSEGGAQLSAVLFRGAASALKQPIKMGDTVVAEGEIAVYAPRGAYQIVVRNITNVGLGEALLRLQALKKKLKDLGWFREDRKKPLPTEIRTIGLVTSPTGAVLHDIINILTRRIGGFHLIVNPVRVQGEGAGTEIARAITEFNSHVPVDVIIVCRGGGSSEDLSPFNEEIVAAACVQSTIPIVSAIGHETDLSVADLVADLRAPTPSAAAELVSHVLFERKQKLSSFAEGLIRSVLSHMRAGRNALQLFMKRLEQSGPQRRLQELSMRFDDMENDLAAVIRRAIRMKRELLAQMAKRLVAPTIRLSEQRSKLAAFERSVFHTMTALLSVRQRSCIHAIRLIDERMGRHLSGARQRMRSRDWGKDLIAITASRLHELNRRLSAFSSNLQALSPLRTLERGYAIVFRGKTNQVVRSVHSVEPQEPLSIMVADGRLEAIVTKGKV